ncbi:MAG: hypothetical protein ACT4PE_17000 [Candidatus Eiseniibacteriota bacterium]
MPSDAAGGSILTERDEPGRGKALSGAVTGVLLAAAFVPFLAGRRIGDGVPGAVLLAASAMLAPAVPGWMLSAGRLAPTRAVAALLSVTLLHLGAVVVLRALRAEPTPAAFAAALASLTALAGAAAAWRAPGLRLPRDFVPWCVGGAAFLLFAWSGTSVVPALEDQDSEVQGTANGIVRELAPVSLMNRGRLHFFAHPPLLHVFSAATITLAGELDTVRPAYDVAREELAKVPAADRERGLGAVIRALRHPPGATDRSFLWHSRVFRAFREAPALLATRAPNFVLGAFAVVLVFAWARRLGTGTPDAVLVAAAYATLPEIVVRSSYGGYYALSAATFVSAAWLASERRHRGSLAGLAGALAALANHKAVVVGGAAFVTAALRRRSAAAVVLLGVAAGTAAFWIWGLAIAPGDFVGEHLLDHGLRRFTLGEVTTRTGAPIYPSRAGVWLEFATNHGWPWIAAAAAGLLWGITRAARRAPDPDPLTEAAEILVPWTLLGAAVFTVIDWRQTKHLALIVPAATVLVAGLLCAAPRRARVPIRAVLAGAVAWNIAGIVRIARDFESLRVTPIW